MSEFIDLWPHRIFNSNLSNFEELCLDAFQYQYNHNVVYREYAKIWGIQQGNDIKKIGDIPFLPIEFFKTHEIKSNQFPVLKTFESSGTSLTGNSKHFIVDLSIYEQSIFTHFQNHFGSIANKCILGLLPSYLEKENSSLVYMVQALMKKSKHPLNGFYLYEHEQLADKIKLLESKKEPYFLFGVTFGLLDFAKKFPIPINYGKIIETGGMKGRKKEITKMELYETLMNQFQTNTIYSEYSMCEMQSQFYTSQNGNFTGPKWARTFITDINDPRSAAKMGKTGVIQVVDLANIHSCCFIQTADLGIEHPDFTFEVLGRRDQSEQRGCSLMVS
jgi:hypothetical protein